MDRVIDNMATTASFLLHVQGHFLPRDQNSRHCGNDINSRVQHPTSPSQHHLSITTPGNHPVASITAHRERHTGHSDLIRDCIIGFSDGLTVPFALTAGLSSLGNSKVVIVGGLAELFAGALSMGLGVFLAALTDAKHYDVELAREHREVRDYPRAEEQEVFDILGKYGVRKEDAKGVVDALRRDEEMWVQFMMDFELQLRKPALRKAWLEAIVMGVSYFMGGLLPMIPYFAMRDVIPALFTSIGIAATVLLAFGFGKAAWAGTTREAAVWSALQTLLIGAIAAGAAYGIVRAVGSVKTG